MIADILLIGTCIGAICVVSTGVVLSVYLGGVAKIY